MKGTLFKAYWSLCFLPGLLHAQQNSAESDSVETIVVSETRSPQAQSVVARSMAIIEKEALQTAQPEHIQQVLNYSAGVNLHRNSGQEMLLAVRSPVLTGAGACGSFLTLENGIPLRPNGFCNVNELFESHFEQAELIEVVKGPTSAFYGNNGLHGAINVINPAAIGQRPFITVGAGNWDQQLSFGASGDSYGLTTSIANNDGYRDSAGFKQQKLSFQQQSEWNNSKVTTNFTATNLDQETAAYVVGKDSYKDKDLRKQNPSPDAYRQASSIRLSQQYEFESGLVFRPFVRQSNMEFLQHFVPGTPVEKNSHHSLGFQSQYSVLQNDQQQLTLGVDAELAQINLLEQQDAPTTGSNFLVATIPVGKHYDYAVDISTLAAFGHYSYQLNELWKTQVGIRAESINFDYDNQMIAGRVDEQGNECSFGGCRFNRPEDREDSFSLLSPKLSLLFTPSTTNTAYINLTDGFRAPQATELYRLQREQQVSDLEPEKLKGVDMGWRQWGDRYQWSLEAFHYNKQNVILRDSDFFYVSNGKTQHQGIEVTGQLQLTEQLQLAANASAHDHRYKNNPNLSEQDIIDNSIVAAPKHLANIFVRYQRQKLKVELHSQYSGEYYLTAENDSAYPGHTLWNLRSEYQFDDQVVVRFNINNLLDKAYAKRANYSSFTQERYFPGQPRNVKLAVQYLF